MAPAGAAPAAVVPAGLAAAPAAGSRARGAAEPQRPARAHGPCHPSAWGGAQEAPALAAASGPRTAVAAAAVVAEGRGPQALQQGAWQRRPSSLAAALQGSRPAVPARLLAAGLPHTAAAAAACLAALRRLRQPRLPSCTGALLRRPAAAAAASRLIHRPCRCSAHVAVDSCSGMHASSIGGAVGTKSDGCARHRKHSPKGAVAGRQPRALANQRRRQLRRPWLRRRGPARRPTRGLLLLKLLQLLLGRLHAIGHLELPWRLGQSCWCPG